MPAPRVRATMFTRQGRRTDPHGHSHSVELHEAASPYRHPRYDGPSAKEKLIPLGPSAASGRLASLARIRRWTVTSDPSAPVRAVGLIATAAPGRCSHHLGGRVSPRALHRKTDTTGK